MASGQLWTPGLFARNSVFSLIAFAGAFLQGGVSAGFDVPIGPAVYAAFDKSLSVTFAGVGVGYLEGIGVNVGVGSEIFKYGFGAKAGASVPFLVASSVHSPGLFASIQSAQAGADDFSGFGS